MPVEMSDATAVWYGDKLYVGGTSDSFRHSAGLYIYTPITDMWLGLMDTPVYWFALTTYHSQLVLVGGREYRDKDEFTNKLWTLNEHGQLQHRWQETLPPMRSKRHSACAVNYRDHLLVAGGVVLDGISNNVEVYDGTCSHWSFTQPLPVGYYNLKSAILDDSEQPIGKCWCLMGGSGHNLEEEKAVYYASLDSLVACSIPSETSPPSPVWKRLTDAPNPFDNTAVFGSRLIAVGGEGALSSTSTVHAYSFQTNSWIHVGDIPFGVSSTCSVVLPKRGELMVVGRCPMDPVRNVMKAKIKGKSQGCI